MRKTQKLSFPPKEIKDERNYEHIILWMLANNGPLQWGDFLEESLNLTRSSLSKYLSKILIKKKKHIERKIFENESHAQYVITPEGKVEYSKVLGKYKLDRQTLLKEKIKRIKEITQETNKFFEEVDINEISIKIRFKKLKITLSYSEYREIFRNEDNYNKTLLFLSINHPDEYPNFITSEEFSKKFSMKKIDLDYYISQIVEENLYPIKFFKIELENDRIYFFQYKGNLEKKLRTIFEEYMDNKFHEIIESTEDEVDTSINQNDLNEIINLICDTFPIFNKELKPYLIKFLPNYIKYRKFKIEERQYIYDKKDILLPIEYSHIKIDIEPLTYFDEIIRESVNPVQGTISYSTKFGILNYNKFKKENFDEKNLKLVNKIEAYLYIREYGKAKNQFEKNKRNFGYFEELILDEIIEYYLKNYEDAVQISNELINKFPNKYVGYLFQAINYSTMKEEDKDLIEKSLDFIKKGLKIAPNNDFLLYHHSQILNLLERDNDALEVLNNAIKANPKNINFLIAKSLILEDLNKSEESIKILNKALGLKPNNYRIITHKARILSNMEKYNKALELYGGALKLKSNTMDRSWIYANLAETYMKLKRYEDSLDTIENAIKLDSKYDYHYFKKGLILEKMGKYTESIAVMNKASELNPDEIYYYVKKSFIFGNYFNNDIDALNEIEKALKKDPNNPHLMHNKGFILLKLNKIEEALKITRKSMDLIPEEPCVNQIMSIILFEMAKHDEAIELIDKAIKLDPELQGNYLTKARFFSKLKEYNKTLDVIDKAIKLDPKFLEFKRYKANILIDLKKHEEALEIIDNLIDQYPKDPENYNVRSHIFFDLGKFSDALNEINKAIELDLEGLLWYKNKCFILNDMENYQDALEVINKFIELNSNDAESYKIKGYLLKEMKNYENALKELDKSIELNPNDAGSYAEKGIVLRFLKKYEDALIELDKSIELDPNEPLGYGAKSAILCDKLHRYDEALKEVNKGLDIDPNHEELLQNKFVILSKLENHNKTLEFLEKMINLYPNNLNFINDKAYTLARLNRKEEALLTARELIEKKPNVGNSYDTYGEILLIFKEYEEALQKFDIAMNLAPESEFIHETYVKMGECYKELEDHERALDFLEKGMNLSKKRDQTEWIEKAEKILSELKEKK